MKKLRILIADDHPVVRQGLRRIIESEPDLASTVDEAHNGQQTLGMVREHHWDLIILDISMPDHNGFFLLEEIRRIKGALPILILSMLPEDEAAIRALKSGANGYLNKETAPEELIRAVRKVAAHGKYVSANLAEQLVKEIDGSEQHAPHEYLSDREYQVMCMLAGGKGISEIAANLHRSPNTISTYRSRILVKMAMSSNAELAQYAIRKRLIS